MLDRTRLVFACAATIMLVTPLAMAQVVYYEAGEYPHLQIRRADLDGTNSQVLVDGVTPWAMALDALRGKLYWIGDGLIRRANLNGSDVEILVSGLGGPWRDLEIDIGSGKMYWLSDAMIRRADLDGSDVELILNGLNSATSLALHVPSGKIYWTENLPNDPPRIRRADLDGAGPEIVLSRDDWDEVHNLEIDPETPGSRMYWGQYATTPIFDGMASARLDGSDYVRYGFDADGNPRGDIVVTPFKVYWTLRETADTCHAGEIRRGNPDGTGETLLFRTLCVGSLAVDETVDSIPAASTTSLVVLAAIVLVISSLGFRRHRRSP
jgi:hypothetical protein